MDISCVGGRPSRARVRAHSHSTRDGVCGNNMVIKMNPKTDISYRRYSDSEDKSTRPRTLPGKLLQKLH
jgi:hypothetical protein